MPTDNVPLVAFNRGLISKLALARTDIKRTALSAETQTNWIPRVLGSMMLRPGLGYIDSTRNDSQGYHIPFVFSRADKAIIEFTDAMMRVRVDESVISRASVSTAVTSGDFSASTGWTDNDEGAAASTITGGKLNLIGTGFDQAIRDQTVTVAVGDQGTEHALRIIVDRGPATLRVGSTSGGDEYINETELGTGEHSLAFTPTGDFYIRFQSVENYTVIVDSCTVEASGAMEIAAPYAEADLRAIRYDQSADVIYLGCFGYRPYKIERRGTRSWSLVKYEPVDGPFRNINLSTIGISADDINGNITLTASRNLFKENHVGALFKIASIGQEVQVTASGENQWSDSIRVTGVGSEREFDVIRSGTFSGTWTVQRSVGEPGNWVDYISGTTTGTLTLSGGSGLDNQIVYYRVGINTGDYTSGTANLSLQYQNGSIEGIVRITDYISETEVDAVVLQSLGNTVSSREWYEGSWSDYRGYPSSPMLHEGRVWWAGKGNVFGSVSDAYESYDGDVEGDAKAINRSIGFGPVDDIKWLLSLQRLILGTDTREVVARSSSFDEPLTPDNFNLKAPSTQGSADVMAEKIDQTGLFIQGSGDRLFRLEFGGQSALTDYQSVDLSELVPDLLKPSVVRIAVQRQPDTRIHCVRSDGKVAVLVSQPLEDVLCWILYETDGEVEDAFVLPADSGVAEDSVYYVVKRTINGSTKRYLEKFALESACQGETLNKQADSFITYEGAATGTITGLDHLEGEEVIVWADGIDLSPGEDDDQTTYTVTAGEIELATTVESAVIGLPYNAPYVSTKLAYAAGGSTALNQEKRIDHLGLIFSNIHHQGIKYGKALDSLEALPKIINDIPVADDTVFNDLDTGMFEFPGNWDVDSRLCMKAYAPRPCTVMAAIVKIKTNDG